MKLSFLLLAGVSLTWAQGPTIFIAPHHAAAADQSLVAGKAARTTLAGTPFLGFVLGPGPLDLRAIVGTTSTAHLSAPLTIPEAAKRLYLPPRQRYTLVEQDGALAVWQMRSAIPNDAHEPLIPIAGTMPHPDLVAFSPRGEAAVLYSRTTERLQIVGGLPVKPSITSELLTKAIGDVSKLAVADDGKLVAALSAQSNLTYLSHRGVWQSIAAAYNPTAWSFMPNTHDLVISDSPQSIVVLLTSAGETEAVFHVLAQGIQPDLVAVTKAGEKIILADSNSGMLWALEPKTMTLRQLSSTSRIDSFSLLRDGHTALLSASPTLSLFQFSPASSF